MSDGNDLLLNFTAKFDDSRIGSQQTQPVNINNLQYTRYKFQTSKIPDTIYMCQNITLPGTRISTVLQPTNFNPVKRPGGNLDQDEIQISFVVDENLDNYQEILTWIRQCSDYKDYTDYLPPLQHLVDDAHIIVLNNSQLPILRIDFAGIFPVSLGKIDFDSKKTQAEYAIVDASFAFTTFDIKEI